MFTPTLRCECAQPGLIDTMRKWSIKHHNVSDTPNFVIIHVGTNISYCDLITRFRRQFRNRLDVTKSNFPEATVLVSELCVQTDIDV